MSEKIKLLNALKNNMQDEKEKILLDEIIKDIESPFEAYCRNEARFRFDKAVWDLEENGVETGDAFDKITEEYFIRKYSEEISQKSESWIDGDFLDGLAENRVSELYFDLMGKEPEPQPEFDPGNVAPFKVQSERTSLDRTKAKDVEHDL